MHVHFYIGLRFSSPVFGFNCDIKLPQKLLHKYFQKCQHEDTASIPKVTLPVHVENQCSPVTVEMLIPCGPGKVEQEIKKA